MPQSSTQVICLGHQSGVSLVALLWDLPAWEGPLTSGGWELGIPSAGAWRRFCPFWVCCWPHLGHPAVFVPQEPDWWVGCCGRGLCSSASRCTAGSGTARHLQGGPFPHSVLPTSEWTCMDKRMHIVNLTKERILTKLFPWYLNTSVIQRMRNSLAVHKLWKYSLIANKQTNFYIKLSS